MTSTTLKTTVPSTPDLQVGPICLGGNVFGWTLDEAASVEVLDAFVAGGGDFIDTADMYSTWAGGPGISERIIGRWLAERGDDPVPVIATKVGSPMPEGTGLARAYVREAVERCRECLGIEQIDLLYAHRPDPATPIVETMREFDALVRGGTVAAVALSNYDAGQLREALDACDAEGLVRPVAVQPEYNLLDRDDVEGGLGALCVTEGIAIAPYYALAAGFLTGKYREGGARPESARAESVIDRYGTPTGWSVLERAATVAARHDVTIAQVAIAWLRTRPGVVAPIASGTSAAHVHELLAASRLVLGADDLELLEPLG